MPAYRVNSTPQTTSDSIYGNPYEYFFNPWHVKGLKSLLKTKQNVISGKPLLNLLPKTPDISNIGWCFSS